MTNSYWEKYERCAKAMSDYKAKFGKGIPVQLLFYDMEYIIEVTEKAIEDNVELSYEE